MKVVRKSLHPLQVAAGDKENLVGAGRMIGLTKATNVVNAKSVNLLSSKKNDSVSPKNDKKRSSKIKEDDTDVIEDFSTGKRSSNMKEDNDVIIEDMTTAAGPSDHYWERLAETRRKALDKALQDNEQLIERLRQLTDENNQYKQLLADAQDIIDTLNEMIAEADSENNEDEETVRQP